MNVRLRYELGLIARMAGSLAIWLRTPVDYQTRVEYYENRPMLINPARASALAVLALTAVTALMAYLPSRASEPPAAQWVTEAFLGSLAITMFPMAFRIPWPSRRWSVGIVVYIDIGLATIALLNPNATASLIQLALLLTVSFHIVYYDGPRLQILHTAFLLLAVGAVSARTAMAAPHDHFLAAAMFLVGGLLGALTLPLQFSYSNLMRDSRISMEDPLTGVLNRRGLDRQFEDLLRGQSDDASLVVAVVDLDRFKEINDSQGHAVGDRVLVDTARRIEAVVRRQALIARVGGDEFVVVDRASPDESDAVAARIAGALTAVDGDAVVSGTAGATTIAVGDLRRRGIRPRKILDAAISRADHTMLAAKNRGRLREPQ